MKREGGYSLTEVMVAVVILAVAILPMAAMFDSALNATRSGGDYDKARALANRKLESALALDYERAVELYAPQTPTSCNEGKFECGVETSFVGEDLENDAESTNLMLLEVRVEWEGKSYEISGLMAASSP